MATKRALGAVLEPVFENPGLLAIGVNTTRPRRRKDGEISEAQIARVAQRLRQARPGNCGWWWRIIRCGPRSSPTCTTCCSGASALAAWTQAGVDLILGGHIHLPYVMPILADRPTAGWVAQAGTTCSWRVRGKVPTR